MGFDTPKWYRWWQLYCLPCYMLAYSFLLPLFPICLKAKGPSLTVWQYHSKERTGLFSLQAGEKISPPGNSGLHDAFWVLPASHSPQVWKSTGLSLNQGVFPEAMSVAAKLGNGHWIAVQPQDRSLSVLPVVWTARYIILPLFDLRLVGQNNVWERICTVDCFVSPIVSYKALINCRFDTVHWKPFQEGGTMC